MNGVKEMRTFNNIATLIKTKRAEHPEQYTQGELASFLGLKSDRLIAMIENGGCSVPLEAMPKLSEVLNIPQDDFIQAVMKDHEESLDKYFAKNFKRKITYM